MWVKHRKALWFWPTLTFRILQLGIREPDTGYKHGSNGVIITRRVNFDAGYIVVSCSRNKQKGTTKYNIKLDALCAGLAFSSLPCFLLNGHLTLQSCGYSPYR